ncbi:hypothetical protein [Actinomadura rugatobispora]|uniref:Uncharacterized protein n=1 Tax=Actinomadura rugatobispora TaxID=1994 RepID=A0ABW0ZQD7_9ACTN|nr:hypothetical protein GCM10010200_035510 [Actinomadura rugatobispora]
MLHHRAVFIANAVAAYDRPYDIVPGALRRTELRAQLAGLLPAPPPYFALPPAPDALNRRRALAARTTAHPQADAPHTGEHLAPPSSGSSAASPRRPGQAPRSHSASSVCEARVLR